MTELARVAKSEHAVISLARDLIAPRAGEPPNLLAGAGPLPREIGPTCAALLEDTLRQLWPALWRRAGGRRVWDRRTPTGFVHTAATLQLLRWLVATPLSATQDELVAAGPLALGDQVVVYLALDAAGDSPVRRAIARQPLVRAAPLAWLGFAEIMVGEPPEFTTLVEDAGAIVIESLRSELAARWRSAELGKRAVTDPAALIAIGARQDATLGGFMRACERQRELATFVLDAAAPLLDRGLSPAPLALDPEAPLGARAAARVAAGALLRAVTRWREWDEQHRAVRFIDDDYKSAQKLLGTFERIGRAGADRAAGWLADLAALAPTTTGGSVSISAP
jgi:hypothetical protein